MRLAVAGVCVDAGGTRIITDVDLAVESGEFVGLVGPNGSGKTTLLRTIYRALRPIAGHVSVNGDDIWSLAAREAARRTAAVLQERSEDIELTVFEIVATGRTPHKGPLDRDTAIDEEICLDALDRVGMSHLARRIVESLSGGERQRVLVARARAQQSKVLVLDEPTNHLDIRHQLELLQLVRGLGITTFAAMHDLDVAARYCDRLFMLDAGRVVAAGTVEDVLLPEQVLKVFGVAMCRWTNPDTGRIYLGFEPLLARSTCGVSGALNREALKSAIRDVGVNPV